MNGVYWGPPARRPAAAADTPEQAKANLNHVVDMLTAMQRYPDQGGPEVMQFDKSLGIRILIGTAPPVSAAAAAWTGSANGIRHRF